MSKSIATNQTKKKTSFPIQIAIPAETNKPKLLQDHTLAVLKVYHIPCTSITIFVSSKEQYDLYTKHLSHTTYHKIIINPTKESIYNFICDYYSIGTPLIVLKETIKGFVEFDASSVKRVRKCKSLIGIMMQGFKECENHEATLWGLYPIANGYYMKPEVTTVLKHISATVWGCVNLGSSLIHLSTSYFEDYERTILHYKRDGKVVRLNGFAPIEEPIKSHSKDADQKQKSIISLLKKYPDFMEAIVSKDEIIGLKLIVKPTT